MAVFIAGLAAAMLFLAGVLDNGQVGWVGAAQLDAPAAMILDEVHGDWHQRCEALHLDRRAHVDVEVAVGQLGVALVDELEARNHPIGVEAGSALVDHVYGCVVLVVAADAFHGLDELDSVALQLGDGADAGKHEDLRAVVDAGAEDDLVGGHVFGHAVAAIRHLGDAVAVEAKR